MSRARARQILGWSGAFLGLVLICAICVLAWLLFTTSGARWVAQTVTSRFAPQISYGALDGTIAGELRVRDFRFDGAADAARIHIATMSVDPTLRMLLSRTLRIDRATVSGLTLHLPERPGPEEPDKPLWVQPPLEVVVSDFALRDAQIFKGRERLLSLRQLDLAARWTRDVLIVQRLALLPGDIEGELQANGRITPAGNTVHADLEARWKEVVIPEALAGRRLLTAGSLDVEGTPQRYSARGELDFGPPGEVAHIVLALQGTDRAASVEKLEVTQAAGRLAVNGKIEFEPVAWDLAARADDFNPGAFLAAWPGRIDLDFSTRGVMAARGPQGTVNITSLAGELRGRPLMGEGQLEFAAPARLAGALSVSSGRSRVTVDARSSERQEMDAEIDLEIASLGDWLPDSRGRLDGRFQVRGTWPALGIEGRASGTRIGAGAAPDDPPGSHALQIRELQVTASVSTPRDPSGEIDVAMQGLEVSGMQFAQARIRGSGSQARHEVRIDADGERLQASMAATGTLATSAWNGEISRLTLRLPDISDLALKRAVRVSFGGGAFSVSQACLADADSQLCVAAKQSQEGLLEASYTFDRVPLALANALAPEAMPGQLRGEVRGSGRIRRATDGQWFGRLDLESPQARLVMLDDEPGETALGQQTFTLYENLQLRATLEGSRADAHLQAALDNGGNLAGTVGVNDIMTAATGLRGEVSASMPTLAPFGAFVPAVANLDGAVDAKIVIGGTLQAPQFTGNVDATRLQVDLGDLGIELREGEVHAEAARGGGFRMRGRVNSGKGHVAFDGTLSERGEAALRIDGQDFLAADIPAARVILAPALTLSGNPEAYLLEGEVAIAQADVNIQKLPKDEAPGASPDIVVVRDGREVTSAAKQAALPLTAMITVKLGERIAVTGYGLDARVIGDLRVREAPGEVTTGSGQLTVSGTYKAYGQDLTIEDGRLLFAGTPLDNPRLAIVAMREIDDDLSTGLRIAGSAKRPVITVISDPEVGEADALSYLVTGRSLSDVGSASSSSQDTLASATQSLQGAAGGLVAKRIGQRLGLDEAGVAENEMIGGSALTIGEYLSPRLYLSYGVGLFEPGEVIALRYKLSDDVGVKVEMGSEETRTGVEYRIEK